ncbi:MAG: ABC transporter ATP-binding protein [Tissierellia bacterium]|nr:ABC transporter ATP-binding protein [Tissierellia bacterium]
MGYSLDDNIRLSISNLSIAFGGLKAVDNLSFQIKDKEIFGLIGPNGAGKTTVFNCITQFYTPDQGEILFRDRDNKVVKLTDLQVHEVIGRGLVRTFQNVEIINELTVLENVLVGAHIEYKSRFIPIALNTKKVRQEEERIKEKGIEVLQYVGIGHLIHEKAGGQPYGVRKKIELARTLMSNPKLIILDEPAAGLNEKETIELTKTIRDIRDRYQCSILLVEHDMGLVMDVCEQICAISFGKFLAQGNAQEIQSNKAVQEAYLGSEA